MLEAVFILLIVQGLMGAFDTLYHHEFLLNLPWRSHARQELRIHAIRNFFYIIVFFSIAWTQWHGIFALLFVLILVVEIMLTLWDFLVEDRTRLLPGTERITHTLLALNYGLILAFMFPTLARWFQYSNEIILTSYGFYSWVLTLFAIGVAFWTYRDATATKRMARYAKVMHAIDDMALTDARQHILITGGSGYIGRQLAQQLINQGHVVTIYTRNILKASIHFKGRVSFIDDLSRLPETEPVDAIVNLAGESIAGGFWTQAYKQKLRDSRIQTAKQVVALCERLATKPKVIVSASAIGYYGNQGDSICDESQAGDNSFSHQLCVEWEQTIQAAEALGIRVCILRLGVVFGPEGGPLAKMAFPFELFVGGRIGSGQQWFSWIHLHDVLRMIVFCINKESVHGIFNATADPVRNHVLARAMGEALKRPAKIPLPEKVVKFLFRQMGEELFLFSTRVASDKIQLEHFKLQFPILKPALAHLLKGEMPVSSSK